MLPKGWEAYSFAADATCGSRSRDRCPSRLVDAWKGIWQFFDLAHEYERAYATDFEIHRPNGVEVYIGVK